ncbi:hypothetical protein F2P81_013836 [Scophthalmus maximus]|uniref:Uncharacterized protein n=1 Tax=Scophthalmus maximus TaxID=52904 RepID=A0A6A4SPB9_SCOMX|nr:hypothetical protein F2P81_013836 [Scophthalmus maximus]
MYAKGKSSSVPSDSQAREKLALYVYEYLLHVGAQKSAQTFLSEIRWEKNITLGEPPGFLHSWWCVFWDLYCAAPERRDTCEHSSEAKAFHDYPFMSPRYPGGPRPPLRLPNQGLVVPGGQPMLPSGMDPSRQQGHPNMGGPMQRMTPPRGMVPLGPQNYGSGMRPPLNALVGPGMPGMNIPLTLLHRQEVTCKDGKCYYGSVNSTLAGNATRVTYSYNFSGHEHVGKNLMTCAECLLWTDNSEAAENGETRHSRNLYIFTKSGQLDDSDLEVFRKQAACLNFPAEFHFGKLTVNIHGHTSYHDGKYYETCADCLLSEDTTLLPDGKSKGRYLYLFTRTGTLEPSELEVFKKQAECLNFLPEYHFVGTELCPDDRERTE